MYDIKNLNIWKDKGIRDIFKCREVVIEDDVSKKKEMWFGMKIEKIFEEIMTLVPGADLARIKERGGGKFRYPIYINEKLNTTDLDVLELSARSSNCLHRAGYRTIGELVSNINSREDLKKIRNCGTKSIDEIMEQLFCYQYQQMGNDRKVKYIKRVLELNNEMVV